MLAVPGQIVDLGRLTRPARRSSAAAAPSRCSVRGDLLFVSQLHSDKVEVFRMNQNPADPSGILTQLGARVHRRHHAAGHGGFAGRPHRLRRQHADRGRLVPRASTPNGTSDAGRATSRSASPTARRTRSRAATASTCSPRTKKSACAGSSRSRIRTTGRSRAATATGRAVTTAAVERRRQRHRRAEGLPAEQGHLRQLAGVVRGAEQRHELVRLVLQRRAGRGRAA